jgi:sugar phosphate isomerase/epimerase
MSQAEPYDLALQLLHTQTRAAIERIFDAGLWTARELAHLGAHVVGMAPLTCPPDVPPDECRAAVQKVADQLERTGRDILDLLGDRLLISNLTDEEWLRKRLDDLGRAP